MEIIYIWIEKYNNLEDLSFNLGSEKKYTYNHKEKMVIENTNSRFVPNFFNKETIVSSSRDILRNLTVIVGENGTGKSSVLDFLRYYKNKESDLKFLIIYKDKDNKYYIETTIENLIFQKPSEKYIKVRNEESLFNTLFFSNILDPRIYIRESSSDNNYLDLSTNSLVMKSESAIEFFHAELLQQVKFWDKYKENEEIKKFLRIPSKINLIIPDSNIKSTWISTTANLNYKRYSDIFIFKKIIKSEKIREILDKDSLQAQFFKNLLDNIISYWFLEIHNILKNEKLTGYSYKIYYDNIMEYKMEVINNVEFEENECDIFYDLGKIALNRIYKSKENINIKRIEKNILEKAEGINEILEVIESLEISIIEKDFAEVPIDKNILKLIKKQSTLKNGSSILSVLWTKMSSGEYAMLNLFSRLEVAKQKMKSNSPTNLLILIDEGELYFHPQWQKNWISYFIEGLKLIFENTSKVENLQLVLTTHSPLVLSDFPDDHVLFLEKNSDTTRATNTLSEGQQTFAANIHTLFSNSFFIQDGLIGSFAKEKINNLIDYLLLNDSEEIKKNEIVIRNLIDFIGEPILKNKLIEMYSNKVKLLRENNIEEEIFKLKKRIENLETKRVSRND